jgi:transposase InsO family protein
VLNWQANRLCSKGGEHHRLGDRDIHATVTCLPAGVDQDSFELHLMAGPLSKQAPSPAGIGLKSRDRTSVRVARAYAKAYTHSDGRTAELPIWLHRYNWHRPHGSLKAKTPISRLGLTEDNVLRFHS